VSGMVGLNSGLPAGPTQVADSPIWPHRDAASRSGRNMPGDIRVADVEHVSQARISSDVAIVAAFCRIIPAIGAVIRVRGNEAVSVNIVAFEIDGFLGQERLGNKALAQRVAPHCPGQVLVRTKRNVDVAGGGNHRRSGGGYVNDVVIALQGALERVLVAG